MTGPFRRRDLLKSVPATAFLASAVGEIGPPASADDRQAATSALPPEPSTGDQRLSAPNERVVKEDLELGFGAVSRATPAGGSALGHRIGIHTFLPGTYNVVDFGAVGDGTTNDTAAIQAAIDAASVTPRRGSCVFFPPGIYRTTSPIRVTAGGVWLCGTGETGATAYAPMGWAGPMIYGDFEAAGSDLDILLVTSLPRNNYRFRMSGIRVGAKPGLASRPNGITLRGCSEFSLDHVQVNGACRAGILIDSCTISQIAASHILANTYGIELSTAAALGVNNTTLTVRDCNFYQNTDAVHVIGNLRDLCVRDTWIEDFQNAFHAEQLADVYLGVVDVLFDKVHATSVSKTQPRFFRGTAFAGAAALQMVALSAKNCTINLEAAAHAVEYAKGSNSHANSYLEHLRIDDSAFYGTTLTSVVASDTGNTTSFFFGRIYASQTYAAASATVALTDGTARLQCLLGEFGCLNMAASLPLRLPTAPMLGYTTAGLLAYNTSSNRAVLTDGANLNTIPVQAAAHADSRASDVATLKADFNALLGKLRAANTLAT